MGIDKLCAIMAVDNEEIALATCSLFQCTYDSLSGSDKREYGKEEALVLGTQVVSCLRIMKYASAGLAVLYIFIEDCHIALVFVWVL